MCDEADGVGWWVMVARDKPGRAGHEKVMEGMVCLVKKAEIYSWPWNLNTGANECFLSRQYSS